MPPPFSTGAAHAEVDIQDFRNAHFPWQGSLIKEWFETLQALPRPDLILTHTRDDKHQDHREVCALTWNTFRDHLILEYEIPKWDGDLGRPAVYMPVTEAVGGAQGRPAAPPFPEPGDQALVRS